MVMFVDRTKKIYILGINYDCIYIWNYIFYSLKKILFDYISIEGLNIQ